jgi:hypothetical protein
MHSFCPHYAVIIHIVRFLYTPYTLLRHFYALRMHSICTHYACIMPSLCGRYRPAFLIHVVHSWYLPCTTYVPIMHFLYTQYTHVMHTLMSSLYACGVHLLYTSFILFKLRIFRVNSHLFSDIGGARHISKLVIRASVVAWEKPGCGMSHTSKQSA